MFFFSLNIDLIDVFCSGSISGIDPIEFVWPSVPTCQYCMCLYIYTYRYYTVKVYLLITYIIAAAEPNLLCNLRKQEINYPENPGQCNYLNKLTMRYPHKTSWICPDDTLHVLYALVMHCTLGGITHRLGKARGCSPLQEMKRWRMC